MSGLVRGPATVRSVTGWATLGTALAVSGGPALAQNAAPITVTPPTLAPERQDNGFQVEIPDAGMLRAPANAEGLRVSLGAVHVEGGFPEVASETAEVTAKLAGRTVTLAEVYAAASEIEAIHARAGYVLARVSVPPQQLSPGSELRVVVTDGYIESVDVSGMPSRVRRAVRARAKALEGKRHVTLAEIEEPLMIASDVPGLTLRSTLMRGSRAGGAKLVLEGSHKLLSGTLGVDNQLDPSLGRWNANLQVSLNSALGLGEQFYGFVSADYKVGNLFTQHGRERVLGGGAIVPLGSGRFALNPEATFARTLPSPAFGAPQTVGTLRRLSLRASQTIIRTRRKQAALNLTVEQLDVENTVPSFAVKISHDRYMALRLGGTLQSIRPSGSIYGASIQFSQGLGSLGAIDGSAARASGVPYSRQGTSNGFSKLNLALQAGYNLDRTVGVRFSARGQTSFGKPIFRSEQFALEGGDGLSAYVGGVTAVDAGFAARVELGAKLDTRPTAAAPGRAAPYVFASFGAGRLEAPTAVERRNISAFNLGAGLRVTMLDKITLGVEYARGISDVPYLDRTNRVSAGLTLRF